VAFSPQEHSWYSFLLEAESTPRPQCGWKDYVNEKFQMTPLGIKPATFWLIAQCLNQMHRLPHLIYIRFENASETVTDAFPKIQKHYPVPISMNSD
jgi:hypothetical protein